MISPRRSRRTRIASLSAYVAHHFVAIFVLLAMVVGVAHAASPTQISLTISSTSVPYKTPITLTATVKSGGSPVTTGLVMFCDASATYCENNSSLLAQVQLSSATGTAVVKIGSGPLGVHSYKAVYRANGTYGSSTSSAVSYTVQGTYQSSTILASSGSVGSYTLASTVSGVGAITSPGPSGQVSFLDTSAGNNSLGTESLGAPVLTNTFSQAPNSPFAIGDGLTQLRSVAIASSYLDADNNLDVVTGDADNVITVLLGNGDGTFQAKVNYPGCPVLSSNSDIALKILLADFNRDGNNDIALGCRDGISGGVAILLGNGDGTFQSPTWIATGDLAGLAMGDFNNDGKLDLAVTSRSQMNVLVLIGNGNGTFQAPATIINSSTLVRNVVVADFDGDGNDDLAYSVDIGPQPSLTNLYVALGRGNGTFRSPTLQASSVGEFLTSGDTNKDGKVDIVSSTVVFADTSHISNSMFVLIGNGNGTFQTPVTYVSDIPSDPHLADVDGDGNADIIAGGSYGALVYHGNGDGTFQPYDEPSIGNFTLTYAVNAGDYNNDGNADLIGTDALSPKAAVALSEVRQAADAVALTGVAVYPLGSGIHNVDAVYSGDSIYITSTSSTVPLRAAPVSTTLNLVSSPANSTVAGQSVTLTATLAPYTVGPPTTTTDTETVTFYNGSTSLGTGVLSSGVATLTTTSLPTGNAALKAVYGGDENYLTSTSSVVSFNVGSIALTTSPNPSNYGQSVALTATVAAGSTGTVGFKDGATSLGTATISGAIASLSISTLTAGSHSLTAVYSGDGSHVSATSAVVTQVVNKINPIMSVTTAGQSTYLSTITVTATVPSDATGSVTFTAGATSLGTATISGGVASVTTSSLPVGNYTITASYAGDTNYNSGTATTTRAVTKASPSSTLTSSLNPNPYGTTVTFTDTLSSSVTGTVTFMANSTVLGTVNVANGVATLSTSSLAVGSVTITATYNGDSNNNTSVATLPQVTNKAAPTLSLTSSANPSVVGQSVTLTATLPSSVTGNVIFSYGSTQLGTVSVVNGIASISTTSLPLGSNTITAQYGGDSNNQIASSTLNQTVNQATTTSTLTSSANPSTYGDSVTLAAAVVSNGTLPVTGTVTFKNGSTTLGTSAIAGGVATLVATNLPGGSNTITATYGGDTNNAGSTGSLSQTVNKATPSLALASSSNPSTVGASVTFTATLSASVTGNVVFTSGTTTLGTVTISGSTATISTSSLAVGPDTITATYSGDNNYNTATGTVAQTVSKKTPTLSASTSGPSNYGDSVTITATLTAGATGSVTFSSGALNLGTGTINASGVATVATSALPTGSDVITASYAGDTNYNSASGTVTQVVSKNTPPVTVTTSGPSTVGNTVTITATVPPSATGTVTFTEGSTTIGTGTVSNGIATVTTSTLPLGTTTITATYNGDSNNNSASGTTAQTVSKVTPSLNLASSINPSTINQTVTFTATLPTAVTGNVTFSAGSTSLGAVTLAAGVASVTTSTLAIGAHTITATYNGDSNNNTAAGSLVQTVNQNSTTVTVTTSGPSTYGGSVTITASVPPGATGTVTFTNGGTTIGTGTVNSSTGTVSVTTSTLPVGNDTITASYGGDTNYSSATGSTTQTVSKATPSVTVTTSGPSTYGDPVVITITLPPGTTGSVTVTTGTTTVGTATVNPSTGVATITTTTLPVGSQIITATYGGDSNNNSVSGSTSQTVSKATVTVSLVSSLNPSAYGQSVIFTATVPSTATGSITFYDGAAILGTGTIAGGAASVSTSSLAVGTHDITAVYSGDSNNSGSSSSSLSQLVNKFTPVLPAPTVSSNDVTPNTPVTITEQVPSGVTGSVTFSDGSTVLGTAPITGGIATLTVPSLPTGSNAITASVPATSTYNAATSPATIVTVTKSTATVGLASSINPSSAGQTVVFTATVSAGATGTVTFSDGGIIIGSAAITGGIATISTSTLTSGTHTITAAYGGDATYNTATSAPLIQTVGKNTPTLPPPSVSNPTQTYGGTETITETVPAGVSGPVTFYSGSNVIGTASIANGVATITVTNLPIGTNSITASTPGDASNNPATSPATVVTIVQSATTVTLASSVNPASFSQAIAFTASVPSAATGTITFLDGASVIGTGAISGGIATLTTSALAIGTHTITASYGGDSTYKAAVSAPLSQVVGKLPTTITLTVSSGSALITNSVTLTAVVAAPVPTPTGSVTFMEGSTVLGTAAMSTNGGVVGLQLSGNAALALSTLASGSHTLTAVYSGDTNFLTSTSAPVTTIIQDFTNKNTGNASSEVYPGDSATYKFTLAPVGTASFLSNVGVAVTGLPGGATYTITPSSVAAGAGSTELTLTVTTSKALNTSSSGSTPGSRHGSPVAFGLLGLVGLGALRRYRSKMPKLLVVVLLLAGSLLPIASLTGCAGGYFAPTPSSYTITVAGTEGTVQRTATAVLVVQQ